MTPLERAVAVIEDYRQLAHPLAIPNADDLRELLEAEFKADDELLKGVIEACRKHT